MQRKFGNNGQCFHNVLIITTSGVEMEQSTQCRCEVNIMIWLFISLINCLSTSQLGRIFLFFCLFFNPSLSLLSWSSPLLTVFSHCRLPRDSISGSRALMAINSLSGSTCISENDWWIPSQAPPAKGGVQFLLQATWASMFQLSARSCMQSQRLSLRRTES